MDKFNNFFLFLFFLFFCLNPLQGFSYQKIVNVDFLGLMKVNENEVRRFVSSIEGTVYSQTRVQGDIKALYKTGLFGDVYVEEKEEEGGVWLVFHVQEKGVIGSIVFRGNKKIKEDELMNTISIRKHSLLDEKRIAESVEAIRKAYSEKDYYLAEVLYEVAPLDTENNELELVFYIHENKKTKIKRISFVGNHVFSDKKLASQMRTKVKGPFSFISSSGKLEEGKLEVDQKLLFAHYMNHGFLKVQIGKPQISLTRDRLGIYITIPVFEGPKYKIAHVDVAGDILTTREEIISHLKMKTGQVYSLSNQQEDEAWITNFYGNQAYAYAFVYPDIVTHDENKTADITYTIQKRHKVSVERVLIEGNTITRDKVIRREMELIENAPFNKNALEASRRRLFQLGYFETVEIGYPRGSRDDLVNIVVKVKEKPTGTVSVGAGFSSLESIIFTASVQKDNFLGYGIRGGVSANLSKLRQEFSFSMNDRYFLDTRWIFSGSMYRYSSALNRDFDQKSFGGSVSFGREVFRHLDVNLGYNIEDVSVTNFSSQVPDFFQQNASGLTSSALTTLAYDTRDNRLFTSKGMLHSFTSNYAGHGLGGDNDFWKMFLETRYFFKMPLKMVLKTRGMAAYVNSLNDNPVPLFERFFMGGINTLRGFDLNSIGPQLRSPRSITGGDALFTYGGNRMLLGNVELEIPIYEPAGIKTVVFVDVGQSYAEDEQIDLSRFKSNYGFGLRWQSPFGPLRFEWGLPFKRKEGESPAVFNFTIGQSF